MRTLLPEIKELILSLIHLHLMLKQLITIKPSLLHQTPTLSLTMDHQQSGLIPTCQMEINPSLTDNDFVPSMSHSPPSTDAIEYFPDDPMSAYQRFGPPDLDNWLPDSGATSHYTPVFSDLHDVEPCHVPVSLADGTTKISTFKGTTDCFFTTTEGQKAILGLADVYYIEGLSHRLLSLTAISATQNFTVIIQNRATTIRFPNNSTYTWPTILQELPSEQAFSMTSQPNTTSDDTSNSPAITFEQHLDTSTNQTQTNPLQPCHLRSHPSPCTS
ncbi:hypothetical protein MHU86_16269 [Fragilaria crotonensis]|nr:hypothetical protein MHU86_16269 [Fragilaria crotonensis]